MNNNNIEYQRQEAMKRRWHDSFYARLLTSPPTPTPSSTPSTAAAKPPPPNILQPGRFDAGDLVHNIVPSVTVVLEGRSICQRINLHNHSNYQSLAKALRQMFAETLNVHQNDECHNVEGGQQPQQQQQQQQLDLSNAIPGHIVAYEDLENDLLLAGDLHWKDFVRVAKRIRILPARSRSRKGRSLKE